jgi:hypothetical protein
MAQGTFKKVGKSKKRMYGKRALLVCGFAPDQQQPVLDLLTHDIFQDLPVIFAAADDSNRTLMDLFALEDNTGLGNRSEMPRALIMSGFTEKELHRLMALYRHSEMPPTLWATLTPTSEKWALSQLLRELRAEAEAMKRHKGGVHSSVHKTSK